MPVWAGAILGEAAAQPTLPWKRILEFGVPGLALFAELLKYSTITVSMQCGILSYCPSDAIPSPQNKPLPVQTEFVTPQSNTAARTEPSMAMPSQPMAVPVRRPMLHNARPHHHAAATGSMPGLARTMRGSGPWAADSASSGAASAPPAAEKMQPRVPINHVHPAYPVRAQGAGVQGEALVAYSVDAAGAVHDPRVLYSTGHGAFDAAVLAAVRSWTFLPASAPTPDRKVLFEFRLRP
jgi:TonB family protein